MYIFLINDSKEDVLYSLDNSTFSLLPYMSQTSILIQNSKSLKLFLKHNYESYSKKTRWSSKEYYLVIISEYIFNNLNHGNNIIISNENTQIQHDVNFRYFLAECLNCNLIFENHSISGKDKILNEYEQELKGQTKWYCIELLIGPLIDMPILGFGLVIIFVMIGLEYGWKIVSFYFLILYFALIILRLVLQILWKSILKILNIKNKYNDIRQFVSDNYINITIQANKNK